MVRKTARNPEVEAYLAALPEDRRRALEAVRQVVFEQVPDVEETMRYRMPTYEREGEIVCAFAAQKRYLSLYLDAERVEAHRQALAGLDVGKSCVRFRRLEQLPPEVVGAILRESVARRRQG